jgi:phage gp36-like protein
VTTYATQADLSDRYGTEELLQLAPMPDGVTVSAAKVARACEDAGDLADGYLRGRHALPLTAIPPLLRRLTAAIARYELHLGGDRQPTEQVMKDRDAAIAFLKDVQAGKADLGIDALGAEPAEEAAGTILSRPGAAAFGDVEFDDYRRIGRW